MYEQAGTNANNMEVLQSRLSATVQPGPLAATSQRIGAIDVLRALTMVLMIFVNDLWSLRDIPTWLEHVPPGVDGMGLADVVFPAFLFIVGLSLPYAIDARRRKGETNLALTGHVLTRALALLVMGVFLVNGETIHADAMGFPKYLWYPLCCLSFLLIWNVYPRNANRLWVNSAKALGILALVALALVYRGGAEGAERFAPQWWGILGLIGWAYLVSGIFTVLSRNNLYAIFAGWLFFAGLSMVSKAGLLPDSPFITLIPDAIRGGTLTALTMGGVLTALVFQHFRYKGHHKRMTMVLLLFAAELFALSLVTRPYWKLAKLGATPAWLFLCSAITLLAFLAVYGLTDVNRKAHWFKWIKPAGTNTLLCYLIPYFAYALVQATGWYLPDVLLTGGVGLFKSFLFALSCVLVTGWLNRMGIKLKL